jgi:hypothetical protein
VWWDKVAEAAQIPIFLLPRKDEKKAFGALSQEFFIKISGSL